MAAYLVALRQCTSALQQGQIAARTDLGLELVAEELRIASRALGEITGEFTTEALLSEIFSTFCIGK